MTHSIFDNREDTSVLHLTTIIKSEVSTSPIVVIFCACLCFWFVCTVIFSHLFNICPVIARIFFNCYRTVNVLCKWNNMLWPLVRIHLSAYNTISSSPLCRVVWNTMCNACQLYSVEWMSKMRSILIIILHAIYEAVCYQLNNFPVSQWLWYLYLS